MTSPATTEQFLDTHKASACIHCGLCLSSCPTYLETGNENNSPRGRVYLMRAIQAGRLPLNAESIQPLDLCLGCRACEVACPSGVQYGALLEETRDFVERNHRRSFWDTVLRRVVIEGLFPYPGRMKAALFPTPFLKKTGIAKLLPRAMRASLELLPDQSPNSGSVLPVVSPTSRKEKKGRVGFIQGCVMNVLFDETNRASIRLLNHLGYDVVVPRSQSCCGALFAHGGNLRKAREFARQNIAAFEQEDLKLIIINAAGCGSTLKEYGHLLHNDAEWSKRAAHFTAKVKDLTEVLADHLEDLPWPKPTNTEDQDKVTYHDACHLAHPQRITSQPRALLRRLLGSRFVELPESDVCCGSAGSYNLTEPDMAHRLQQRKLANILQTGAKTVVTTNPGCLLQINAGLKQSGGHGIRALHIADFLVEQLPV